MLAHQRPPRIGGIYKGNPHNPVLKQKLKYIIYVCE